MSRLLRRVFPRVGKQQSATAAVCLDRLDRGMGSVPLDPSVILIEAEPGNNNVSIARATWGFLALGLFVRLVRFLVVYPIWPDEAFVAANFLERGYLDLVRPLDYVQVCPILFLWIELTVVRLFGFSEWSLRLFPALCGLASMVLFRHLATRVLRRDSPALGRWDFRDVGFADPPQCRGQAVRIRPVRRLDLVGNRRSNGEDHRSGAVVAGGTSPPSFPFYWDCRTHRFLWRPA